MPAKKTVFVIGAGASVEAELPSGAQLRSLIAKLLAFGDDRYQREGGDELVERALRMHSMSGEAKGSFDLHIEAARHISQSMPLAQSIDNFIDMHRGNAEVEICGKLAITRAILTAERGSLLYVKEGNIYNTVDVARTDTVWYNSFFRLLTLGCDKTQLKERFENITLIVFNYDRCLEHFLYHAIRIYYQLTSESAIDVVSALHIYHPYGMVGRLPWQTLYNRVGFGAALNPDELLNIAKQIKTFTEGANAQESEVGEIRSKMGGADTVVFLGFAYHPLNIRLIQPGALISVNSSGGLRTTKVFGTAKGISSSDCNIIVQNIAASMSMSATSVVLSNELSCFDFLNEYSRSISLSD